jgi:hypothetical protein
VAADKLLGLGWGYHWPDLWGALAISAMDAVLYSCSRVWFRLIGFYARTPRRHQPDQVR